MKACSEGRAGDDPGLRTVLLVTVLVILFVTLLVTLSSNPCHTVLQSLSHCPPCHTPCRSPCHTCSRTPCHKSSSSHCPSCHITCHITCHSACQIFLSVPHASIPNQDSPLNFLPCTRCIYNLVCLIASFEKKRKDLFHNKN